MLIIGVDTGGTFTDFIWKDGEHWGEYKLLSTPHDPSESVLKGLRKIAADKSYRLVHGSTVATNAILEKRGARTALITNRKFEDIIEIARQNRGQLYNLCFHKNPPLVPRELRFGLPGRINHSGQILENMHESDIEPLIVKLQAEKVESIAVSLLFSFNNPKHERLVRDVLKRLNIPLSLSHETLAEFREFERTSTTVINAYVSPKMTQYITRISNSIGKRPFRIMQSNGGSISAETAMRESVRTILSGPAGGAVGAFAIARMAGISRLITFDMGGTSTDVALLDETLPLTMESSIAEYPVKVPMIDIHTVGAGGGSLAATDAGGALKVGPESAGADPGPICYGRGKQITVTDANLFLGRLIPEHFLGGKMNLDSSLLHDVFRKQATKLGLSPEELAEGILDIANTTMERAIKVISVERGFDPREFTLFSFGGAGGLHAAYLARQLNMGRVFIPRNPGILSAAGMLMADVIKDYSQTIMLGSEASTRETLESYFNPLETKGRKDLEDEGIGKEAIQLERYLDMRYRGQSFELMVPYQPDFYEQFHQLHDKTYGYCNRNKEVEVVNVRLRAIGKPDKPEFPIQPESGETMAAEAILGQTKTTFDGRQEITVVLDREKLQHGNRFSGPAILVEYSSTIVVPPFSSGHVDKYGNIILTIAPS